MQSPAVENNHLPLITPSPMYHQRRQHLAVQLRQAGGGIALIPTAPERQRNSDSTYPFRHDSYFHYLSGFDEPQSWLVLQSSGHSTLFCRSQNTERSIWDGPRLGPEAAPQALGVDQAHPIEKLDDLIPTLISQHSTVWTIFGATQALEEQRLKRWISNAHPQSLQGVVGTNTSSHRDLAPLLAEMRLIKDPAELATMRQAAAISASGHARAMRFCAHWFHNNPGKALPEYVIEAELQHEFRRHGAQSVAYNSIVAAGANACILHYIANNGLLQPEQLCLMDAGCELNGYASDISRTFPASGRFTAPQRVLYDIVLAAQEAAITATRPGARQRDAHHAAVRVLTQGMLDTGLLNPNQHGNVDDAIASTAYRQFYMHGTGHWLGRDVHDVGEYLSIHEEPIAQLDTTGQSVVKKPSRHLQPGMVLTIEPGLYVRPAPGVPEPSWNIGIRIEDDVIITPAGCELISRDVPVMADEIERLMKSM
jgi:Xaa-Pro aminopeptidase